MTDNLSNMGEELTTPGLKDSPRHGFQGDRGEDHAAPAVPSGLTIAISREAGSRGGSIAQRAGHKLGWQVYRQETLEYIAQEGSFRQELASNLTPAATDWVERNIDRLLREQSLSRHPQVLEMARIILALGSAGEVVLLGRGAGYILPRVATLNVRIFAPIADREAYMGQWLRLTAEEAAEQVRVRDARRAEFIAKHFHREPGDVNQYDLLLNSSLLGEDLCADLIVRAARGKVHATTGAPGS